MADQDELRSRKDASGVALPDALHEHMKAWFGGQRASQAIDLS